MTIEIREQATASETIRNFAVAHAEELGNKTNELFLLTRLFEKCDCLPLTYPFSFDPAESERPDFIWRCPDKTIGVEVTRFQAEQAARAHRLAFEAGVGGTTTPFDFDSPHRTNDEILARMTRPPMGLTDWANIQERFEVRAEALESILRRKASIPRTAAVRCDEYWLVVEDHMHLGRLEIPTLRQVIHRLLEREFGGDSYNMMIFTLHDEVLAYRRDQA